MPAPTAAKYGVLLDAGDGQVDYEEVRALSPQLAIVHAENSRPGSRATAIVMRWEVLGRCRACNAVLFSVDQPHRSGRALKCRDC